MNFFKIKVAISWEIGILMVFRFFEISAKNCSYAETFWHLMLKKICSRFRQIEQDEQIEVRWMSTLDVKRWQIRNNFSRWWPQKKLSQFIRIRISQDMTTCILKMFTYENNIRSCKKTRYIARTNLWELIRQIFDAIPAILTVTHKFS